MRPHPSRPNLDHFGISLFSGPSARTASRATERRVIDRLSILTNAAIDQGACEPFRAPSVSIGPHLERSNHGRNAVKPAQSRSIRQARTSINQAAAPIGIGRFRVSNCGLWQFSGWDIWFRGTIPPRECERSMADDRLLFRKRLWLALLICFHTFICCLSLVFAADQKYGFRLDPPTFHLFYDPARLYSALTAVAAYALVSSLFAFGRFSFGYFRRILFLYDGSLLSLAKLLHGPELRSPAERNFCRSVGCRVSSTGHFYDVASQSSVCSKRKDV